MHTIAAAKKAGWETEKKTRTGSLSSVPGSAVRVATGTRPFHSRSSEGKK